MKALSWPASIVFGAVVLATAVSGQELPVPTLPPEPPPDAGPSTPGGEPPATDGGGGDFGPPTARWHYGLGVGVGYDSNIAFRVGDGRSSWAVSPRGNLARVFTGPRVNVRLAARGSWRGYRQENALNRYNASLGLSGSYRPSPDTTWQANASYELGYSDSSPILSDQGVLLPLVKTRTAEGGLGVRRKLSKGSSLRLRGRISRVEFDEQDPLARGLATGQHLRGTAALDRELGAKDSMAIQYSLGATLARQGPLSAGGSQYHLTHFGSLQWNHVLGRRSAFLLEGGASYTPEAEEAGLERRASFHGGISYSRQVDRASLTLFARREVTPAFGLGVSRIQTRFGVNATMPLGRAWTFDIRGTHSELDTPEGAAVQYGTPDEVSASLSRSLGRHFAVSCEGRYRRRGAEGGFPTVEAYQVGLFLSFGGP